jgi:hypothetical protein
LENSPKNQEAYRFMTELVNDKDDAEIPEVQIDPTIEDS